MADRPNHNARLRAVREGEFQMSRQEFARLIVETGDGMGEAVGCTARLVAAWEDGDVRLPRPVYQRILTRLTVRTVHALGFRSSGPAPVTVTAAGPDSVDAVGRRTFLADGAGAALAMVPGVAPDKGPGRIGVREVLAVGRR